MEIDWAHLLVSVLAGLATAIPLVIQLVRYVQKAIQERNWPEVVKIVTGYMERAETMFEKGSEKKEWVLALCKASAELIEYDVDMNKISELIDSLCEMSKVVNALEKTEKAAQKAGG